jgi:hypothetical protein
MFWQSVILGLQGFGNWHILVGMLGMMVLTFLWRLIAGLIFGGAESGVRAAAGCFMFSLGGIVVQALAVSLFVLICLPSIVLDEGFTPSRVVSFTAAPVLKTGLISLGLLCLLCFLPVVGRLISETPGVPTFLIGIFVFRAMMESLYEYQLSDKAFPDFWLSLAYIGIGLFIAYSATFTLVTVVGNIQKRVNPSGYEPSDLRLSLLIGALVSPVVGIIPLLMYGKYAALFLQSR